jgi:DNA-binding MarR family transcriptional regulator
LYICKKLNFYGQKDYTDVIPFFLSLKCQQSRHKTIFSWYRIDLKEDKKVIWVLGEEKVERVLEMNKIYSRCRSIFSEGDVKITFNEALILEVVFNKPRMIKELQEILVRDRGYICRAMKKMVEAGFILKVEKFYTMTPRGRREATRNREIFRNIMKELEGDQGFLVSN